MLAVNLEKTIRRKTFALALEFISFISQLITLKTNEGTLLCLVRGFDYA
jgi:hypothetical protein